MEFSFKAWRRGFKTLNLLEISRAAILHNFDWFKNLDSGSQVIPVLKSNAYGHGLDQVAEILKHRSFPYIAVDGYFEALRIRKVSRQPVLIMGPVIPENFARMRYQNFAFVVQDETSIRALGVLKKPVKVHLEINTGMNRLGVKPEKLTDYLQLIKSFSNLELEGVMSHLADADGVDGSFTAGQVKLFDSCIEQIRELGFSPRLIHLAQTAGSLKSDSKYANAMRPGIGLYGINPLDPKDPSYSKLSGLRPALTLTSTIAKVIELNEGDRVSYNGIFEATKPTRIGVLSLGYYEGIPRVLSNRGVVKYRDQFLPIAGKICMNHTMIDLGDSSAQTGDTVTVISSQPGDKNSVQTVGRESDLFSYAFLVGLNQNLRRVVVK